MVPISLTLYKSLLGFVDCVALGFLLKKINGFFLIISQAIKGADVSDIVHLFASCCRLHSTEDFFEENQWPSSENSSEVSAALKETDKNEDES